MSGVTKHKESECPSCKRKIDAVQAIVSLKIILPNDFSLCYHCGTWNKFAEDLSLIPLEEGEMEHLPADLIMEMEELSNRIKKINKLNKEKDEN